MVFLFLNAIILLNLLIAILSNTYATIIDRSNMEFAQILLTAHANKHLNKYYGFLIILPPPLCIVNLVFLPLIPLIKKPKKFNNFLIKGFYLIIWLTFFLIFNAVSLSIVIPLAWVKIVLLILSNKYLIDNNILKFNKTFFAINLLSWLILGLPYLYFIHFKNDILLFISCSFL